MVGEIGLKCKKSERNGREKELSGFLKKKMVTSVAVVIRQAGASKVMNGIRK